MYKLEIAEELKNRLTLLLEDPIFAKARQERADRNNGSIADSLVEYNMTVSEEILNLNELSVGGTIREQRIESFRKSLAVYMEINGTGNKDYDNYVSLICEYLVLVAEEPLHPLKVRHFENNLTEDTKQRKYCSVKTRYMKDQGSLCRFCVSLSWPETT